MTTTAPIDILTRMNAAVASVGVVAKDKTNPHFRYDYLSEEAVKQIAAKACRDHGIAPKTIRFVIVESVMVPRPKGEEHRVTMSCELGWDDGVSAEGYGCGMDPGDKAIMKAQTAAIREAWKNRLCIATGHDPEADEGTDQRTAEPAPTRERPPAPPTPKPANGNGAAPKAQASAPARSGSPPALEIVPFGRNKGQHISAVDDRDLAYLADAARRSLADPDKARFHDAEQRRLEAIELEQDARRAMAAGADRGPPRHADDPPPPSDDDIPF